MAIEFFRGKIRFDRRELAGSFGDIGTDFPLVVSLILICGLDPASVLIMFGLMQIMTGVVYGVPMPVQPLKAMSVIMISQKLGGNLLYGAGIAIGLTMLFLTATGLLKRLADIVPKVVIRGIQFGLGMQLAGLALKEFVPSAGWHGYVLAFVSFVIAISLLKNHRYPAALFIIVLGILYAVLFKINVPSLLQSFGLDLPQPQAISREDIWQGFLILAIPQIFLSLGNSVLATRQIVYDLFPKKSITIPKIGLTYSFMNLVVPWFGGIPVCHGSGGIAGHYTFGARTGGSVLIYGLIYLSIGLFFSQGFEHVIEFFPKPVLGVILFFEGWVLMKLVRDVPPNEWGLAFMVGLACVSLPYGYVIGLVSGTCLAYLLKKDKIQLES